MSLLKAAIAIAAVLVMAGVGGAQATNNKHLPVWNFGLIDGLGVPLTLLDGPSRIPAINLNDPKGPPKKPSGPDWKTQFEENTTNGDNWSTNEADKPDGEWQQTTVAQDPKQWTTQTATRP